MKEVRSQDGSRAVAPSSPHPPQAEEHSFRPALLRIPGAGSTGAAQPGIPSNPTLPWSLEPPFSPAPHGPPPTHPQAPSEEANWTIPQCTPPAPLFIRGAVGEGLISAVARAAAQEDLQRETLLKRPAGSISVLPFVLHLSLSIFPEGQEQGTRIQWTCCSIKTPAASCYHLCYLLQTILSPTRAGKRGCQGMGLPGKRGCQGNGTT